MRRVPPLADSQNEAKEAARSLPASLLPGLWARRGSSLLSCWRASQSAGLGRSRCPSPLLFREAASELTLPVLLAGVKSGPGNRQRRGGTGDRAFHLKIAPHAAICGWLTRCPNGHTGTVLSTLTLASARTSRGHSGPVTNDLSQEADWAGTNQLHRELAPREVVEPRSKLSRQTLRNKTQHWTKLKMLRVQSKE